MTIIVSKDGKNAKKIEKSSFDKEDYLQQYVYDNPDSIPLYELKDDIRLLILVREFPTNSGPIDALGIDKDGEVYVIETKLYRNPDKRTVVAQMLDYGASLWTTYRDFADFTRILDTDINAKFSHSLNQRIKEFYMLQDDEVSALLDNVKHNLASATFKFVVLMDQLDTRLRDLVVFLNQNSQFDIYAVQVEYYKHQDYEIMIPKLYGAEVKKAPTISTAMPRRKWDESTFFAEARAKLTPPQLTAIERLFVFFKANADVIDWGSGSTYGSFNPRFSKISKKSPLTITSNGFIWLNFIYLDGNPIAVKFRDALRANLQKINRFELPPYQSYNKVEADDVAGNVDAIIEAFRKSLDSL